MSGPTIRLNKIAMRNPPATMMPKSDKEKSNSSIISGATKKNKEASIAEMLQPKNAMTVTKEL